jgi:hypothetical protein
VQQYHVAQSWLMLATIYDEPSAAACAPLATPPSALPRATHALPLEDLDVDSVEGTFKFLHPDEYVLIEQKTFLLSKQVKNRCSAEMNKRF